MATQLNDQDLALLQDVRERLDKARRDRLAAELHLRSRMAAQARGWPQPAPRPRSLWHRLKRWFANLCR